MSHIRRILYEKSIKTRNSCKSLESFDFTTKKSFFTPYILNFRYWFCLGTFGLLKFCEFFVSIPFFLTPKHYGFKKYALRDQEQRYLDSYASYLNRRFAFTSSLLSFILIFSFINFLQAPISFSQLKTTNIYVVCAIDCDISSIQKAIDKASDGDIIRVLKGSYKENIDFKGKNIIVKSDSGPLDTSIVGDGKGSVITMKRGEGKDSVLEGFTISGGTGTLVQGGTAGGGIFISGRATKATIRKNIITYNEAQKGGGIYIQDGSSIISDNEISHNKSSVGDDLGDASLGWGGGICMVQSKATLEKNTIQENAASFYGGGVMIYGNQGSADVTNNIFQRNATLEALDMITGGGALAVYQSFATIMGNSFDNNASFADGGAILISRSFLENAIGSHTPPDSNIFSNNKAKNNGGAIALFQSQALIDGNIFQAESRDYYAMKGGGVATFSQSQARLLNNTFQGLKSNNGGAVYSENGSLSMINNLLKSNETEQGGAAVEVQSSAQENSYKLIIQHNVFTENATLVRTGSALFLQGNPSVVQIINNIIEKTSGGFGFDGASFSWNDASQNFNYNNVWQNEKGEYGNEVQKKIGINNLSTNSLFVNIDQNNYHLQNKSLLIDRGLDIDPLIPDFDQELRPFGAGPDIGLDEVNINTEYAPIYVDTKNGDDINGTGDSEKPFQSIEQALALIRPFQGGTIFAQGKRTTTITIKKQYSGTEKNPLKISQWIEKEDAVIDADDLDDGIVVDDARFVWINGLIIKNAIHNGVHLINADSCTLSNNVIYDNEERGVFVDSSNQVSLLNNTLVSNATAIDFSNFSIAGRAQNNIIDVDGNQYGISVNSDSQNLFQSDYNNIFLASEFAITGLWSQGSQKFLKDWQIASKVDAHSIYGDPLFISRSSGDFRVQNDSPSIDGSSPQKTDIPDDRLGIPRPYFASPDFVGRMDHGAYEVQSPIAPKILSLANTVTSDNHLAVLITIASENPLDTQYAITSDNGNTWLQSDGTSAKDIYWNNELIWQNKDVATKGTYTYKAKSRNAKKTTYSGWGETLPITTPLDAPSNLSTENIKDSSALLSWNDSVDDYASYTISYGTDSSASNKTIIENIGSNGHKLNSLASGTTYYWKVRIANNNGYSVWSNTAVFTTTGQKTVQEAPADGISDASPVSDATPDSSESATQNLVISSTRALADGSSATITWTTNQASTSQIEYGTTAQYGTLTQKESSLITEHTTTISSLTPDTLYHFRILAENSKKESVKSSDFSFITSETPKTPILISPESWMSTTDLQPTITGLAQSGLTVKIYFDNLFSGETAANTTDNGTGSFAYTPTSELIPGEHSVQIITENKSDIESVPSENHTFMIFTKEVTSSMNLFYDYYITNPINSTTKIQPHLVGLATAGTQVKIYIDSAISAEFTAAGDPNTVVSFAHTPPSSLSYGAHRSYYELWNGDNLIERYPELVFRVVHDLPTPTLLAPNDSDSVSPEPIFAGIASDENMVSIYIDNIFAGQTQAAITASTQHHGYFEFKVQKPLKRGKHSVQVQAEDAYKKKSKLSDPIYVYVE